MALQEQVWTFLRLKGIKANLSLSTACVWLQCWVRTVSLCIQPSWTLTCTWLEKTLLASPISGWRSTWTARAGHAAANQRRRVCGTAEMPSGSTSTSTALEHLPHLYSEPHRAKVLVDKCLSVNTTSETLFSIFMFSSLACLNTKADWSISSPCTSCRLEPGQKRTSWSFENVREKIDTTKKYI